MSLRRLSLTHAVTSSSLRNLADVKVGNFNAVVWMHHTLFGTTSAEFRVLVQPRLLQRDTHLLVRPRVIEDRVMKLGSDRPTAISTPA